MRFRFGTTIAVAAGATLFIALAFAAVGFGLWFHRGRVLDEGHRVAANLAHVLAEQTARTVQAVDLTLISMVDAQTLRPSMPVHDAEYEDLLRAKLSDLPFIRALFVIGADGFITQDTDHPKTPHVSLADRPYFIVHRENPELGLHINPPLISRSVGVWFVAMSRRIDRPDGGFGGIAVAAVEPRYFEGFYETLQLGDRDAISLFLRDGTMVARSPYHDQVVGTSFADDDLFRRLRDRTSGTFTGVSPVDGVRRIVSYRTVDGFPLVVAVALDRDALLAEWRTTATQALAGTALLVLLVGLLAALVIRQQRQRAALRRRLTESQRLEALGRMTGGVAHDFRNLMAAVASGLTLIRKRTAEEAIRQLADETEAAVARGTKLTSQLLTFARRQDLTPRAVEVNTLISDLEPLLRNAAGANVELSLELAPDLWPCTLDPTQFDAALLNLVVNARDAMPSGGRVRIATANRKRGGGRMIGMRPGDYVSVTVTDNGEGMRPDVLPQVFEPFFTTKGPGKGTGLGLSQVYGFVRQLGGDVRIESRVGAGTAVELFFPRVSGATAAERAPRGTAGALPRGREASGSAN